MEGDLDPAVGRFEVFHKIKVLRVKSMGAKVGRWRVWEIKKESVFAEIKENEIMDTCFHVKNLWVEDE